MYKIHYYLLFALLMGAMFTTYAQPAFFKVRIENVGQAYPFTQSGVFNTPVDSASPGPLFPGAAYEFSFDAAPGSYLSLATMFVQSNDLFYAPGEMGIALYDNMGMPMSGDMTAQLDLWDSGTELNEAPGEGANQAPRQSGANTGAVDTSTAVRLVNDGYTYPEDTAVIRLMLTHNGGTSFTARIENVSTDTTLMLNGGGTAAVPLAPGVFVVHTAPAPLFTVGSDDRGAGLEAIAEDGDPAMLGAALADETGVTPVLAPGIFVVHGDDDPLFTVGSVDRGEGLEDIAEDGNPTALAGILRDNPMMTGGAFAVPVGSTGPGPITPGGAYEFTVISGSTGKLSFATMFVQSNDLFYAPDGMGIALFDGSGMPVSGDITDQISLWDAGTELNEIPGIGLNQAPRQSGADTGPMDTSDVVRLVNDGYMYPADTSVLKVTIAPMEATHFTVTIENVSMPNTLPISMTDSVAVPLAPGTWVLHTVPDPLFTVGEEDRGLGLEGIAEDGDPSMLGTYISTKMGTPGGVFNTPLDSAGPGPLFPGAAYQFSFVAAPGTYLSLATMFVQSNDLFYAPDGMGIALFDGSGMPISGDVTDLFDLWDSGTEENEQPGVGMNQAPRQSGANMGAMDMDSLVRLVSDAFAYPEDSNVIRVTINSANTAIERLTPENSPLVSLKSYPNPFTATTTIRIQLEERMSLGLNVYNMSGQLVWKLAPEGELQAGVHEFSWEGTDQSGHTVAPGIYIVRLHAGNTGSASLLIVRQ